MCPELGRISGLPCFAITTEQGHQIHSVCDEPAVDAPGSVCRWREERKGTQGANHIYTASSPGRVALAMNYDTGMMILALAMGHTVERPVMGMGGGTIKPMERLPAAV